MNKNKVFVITQGINDITASEMEAFISKDIEYAICKFENHISNKNPDYFYKLIMVGEIKNNKFDKKVNIIKRKEPEKTQINISEFKKIIKEAAKETETAKIIEILFEGKIIND